MNCVITQGFYDNATSFYKSIGMLGHGGEDENCGYASPIYAPLDGFVSNILDAEHPATDGYWAVYLICDFKGELGELCVGHCSKITVKVGDQIKNGQLIGYEGNHGQVYEDGVQITLNMQAQGDTRGHHRHWQWRPLVKTSYFDPKKSYLTAWGVGTYRDKDGFFYQVKDFDNGYKGLSPEIKNILDQRSLPQETTEEKQNQVILLSTKVVDLYRWIMRNLLSR